MKLIILFEFGVIVGLLIFYGTGILVDFIQERKEYERRIESNIKWQLFKEKELENLYPQGNAIDSFLLTLKH